MLVAHSLVGAAGGRPGAAAHVTNEDRSIAALPAGQRSRVIG
jgi:hypothetical protein